MKNYKFEVVDQMSDSRYIVINGKLGNRLLSVGSYYASNAGQAKLMQKLLTIVRQFAWEKTILEGDTCIFM